MMPWAIASQTIPIPAIAPMIIVVLNSIGITGLLPKAVISAYLSFFPVAVGMVKGLRSPDAMDFDLVKAWRARSPGVLEAALAVLDALSIHFAQGGDGGKPCRCHRRRASDRCGPGGLGRIFWRAAVMARRCRSGARFPPLRPSPRCWSGWRSGSRLNGWGWCDAPGARGAWLRGSECAARAARH